MPIIPVSEQDQHPESIVRETPTRECPGQRPSIAGPRRSSYIVQPGDDLFSVIGIRRPRFRRERVGRRSLLPEVEFCDGAEVDFCKADGLQDRGHAACS